MNTSVTRWTIGKTLSLCIGGLALVTLALVTASVLTQRKISQDLERLATRTAPALKDAEELSYAVEGMGSALRDSIVAAVQHDTATIQKDLEEIDTLEAEFSADVAAIDRESDLPEAKALAADCLRLMNEVRDKSHEIATLVQALKPEAAAAGLAPVEALVQKCQDTANRLSDLQAEDLARATRVSRADERRGMIVLVSLAVVAFLTLGFVAVVVRGVISTLVQTVTTLKLGNERVTAAATQVAATAQTLAQGASEQAASLEETSASMEEMASMTRQNAQNSDRASQLMSKVEETVHHSQDGLRAMTESMDRIRDSSTRIAKIITAIDEIAFQTNILALNAAVEAARAGEAGMGFAVVADEVRNLAQRSAQAASDTTTLIQESIGNAHQGHEKVDVVVRSIGAIGASLSEVKGLVTEVSRASQHQTQGIDQVAKAVVQMEQITQSTAASAEESAAASEELSGQAEATLLSVECLEALVVATASARPAIATPPHVAFTGQELSPPASPVTVTRVPLRSGLLDRRSASSKGARLRHGVASSSTSRSLAANDDWKTMVAGE